MGKKTAAAFKVAYKPLTLYGVHHKNADGSMILESPFRVPAGAFYGRDSRGYWVLIGKRDFRITANFHRFNMVDGTWYLSRETGTDTIRLIWEECQKRPEILKIPIEYGKNEIVFTGGYTQKELFATSRESGAILKNKYKSIKAGSQHAQKQREKVSMLINVNPAEKSYSRLDEDINTKSESYELFWNRIAKRL